MARTIGVAIAVPEPWGTELQDFRERLGDPRARSIPTHVTLLPPVTVDDHDLDAVTEHLAAVARAEHPFAMLLRGTGTFRPVSPVVFVAVARGISECERVAEQVRSGLLALTLRFPYHPHVTVAHDVADHLLDKAFEELAGYEAAFDVDGFHLYEHVAGRWQPRRRFAFGAAGPGA